MNPAHPPHVVGVVVENHNLDRLPPGHAVDEGEADMVKVPASYKHDAGIGLERLLRHSYQVGQLPQAAGKSNRLLLFLQPTDIRIVQTAYGAVEIKYQRAPHCPAPYAIGHPLQISCATAAEPNAASGCARIPHGPSR